MPNEGMPQVVEFSREDKQITVTEIEDTGIRTDAYLEFTLVPREEFGTSACGEWRQTLLDLSVTQSVQKYSTVRLVETPHCESCGQVPGVLPPICLRCGRRISVRVDRQFVAMERIDEEEVGGLPLSIELRTVGVRIEVPRAVLDALPRGPASGPSSATSEEPSEVIACRTAMSAILKAIPERILCDPCDVDGHLEVSSQGAHLYVFDTFPEGLGVCEQFHLSPQPVLRQAMERLKSCTCADPGGCIVCCHRPGVRSAEYDKSTGEWLLRSGLG